MKIVISPAKTLDFETPLPTSQNTQPSFLETTSKLNNKLARLSKKNLGSLMSISSNLVELNHQRYLDFQDEHTTANSRQAVYAFAGDVYVGLDAYTIPNEKIDRLQDSLRILSGYYGILKPLDLIQPYRLEMGTDIGIGRKADLYEVWREKVTSFLNDEMEDGEVLVNLASKEYFKAIDTRSLNAEVVSPVFKDYKNGKLKIISFFAKKARGAMARFIVENDIRKVEDLKAFDLDGYRYSEEATRKEKEPVFTR